MNRSANRREGRDCYISLLCSHIILTLLQALRALAKFSIISQTQKFRYNNASLKSIKLRLLCMRQNSIGIVGRMGRPIVKTSKRWGSCGPICHVLNICYWNAHISALGCGSRSCWVGLEIVGVYTRPTNKGFNPSSYRTRLYGFVRPVVWKKKLVWLERGQGATW